MAEKNRPLYALKNHPMEYDDELVRQLVDTVVVESKEQIRVIFVGGLEIELLEFETISKTAKNIFFMLKTQQKEQAHRACSFCW